MAATVDRIVGVLPLSKVRKDLFGAMLCSMGGFSFRLNLENVAKMKDLVRSFRREVTALYSEEQKPNAVYHCSLAVFPIFIPKKD